MAYIILPSRRTRQPQGAVRVDWSNPLARGLVDAFVPPSMVSLVHGLPIVGSYVATANGLGYKASASFPAALSDRIRVGTLATKGRRLLTGTAYSYICGVQYYQGPGWPGQLERAFYSYDGAGSTPRYGIVDCDVAIASYVDNIESRIENSLTALTWSADTVTLSGTLYVDDGSRALTGQGTGPWRTGVSRDILFAGSNEIAANIAAIWDGQLTAAEVREFDSNPYQLLAPDPRRIYFAPSGGGATIFESTFADSWSLSDTYSASANLVSTYADSPTVIDSSSSSAVFSSAFDETIPVSDGPSADMGGTANRTQEESFTITDAYSASMVATATISETLSAEASLAASAIFNATFAETLPIVDGEEADAGRISDIAENVSVTDAYTAGIVAQVTQAESVTTSDTYDTIAIYNPALEETLSITDAVGATLTVPTSGTVDLSQESIDALALEIMNQLTSVPVRRL